MNSIRTQAKPNIEQIKMQDVLGKGYATFWNFKGDEVILMGSKGSKKSKTIALRWMFLLKQYPKACLLAMRNTGVTLLDSVYADLKWAAKKLKLMDEWKFIQNPLSARNEITGQKIFFRGLDDWQKNASLTTDDPDLILCFSWFEEAYEMDNEDTYVNTRMSIRGELPKGYFNQSVASFNPWNEQHFMVRRLTNKLTPNEEELDRLGKQEIICKENFEFEYRGEMENAEVNTLYMITNYKINEFLDKKDYAKYKQMEKDDYSRYKTVGLGMPGVSKGLIFKNWRIEPVDINDVQTTRRGLDFGYSNDPSAFVQLYADVKHRRIYIFNEFGATEFDNEQLADVIRKLMPPYGLVKCENEPKSIAELNKYKINAIPAIKGKDSVDHGIKYLQGYEIIIDPSCVGTIEEFSKYKWKIDKLGNPTQIPEDKNNHYIDAIRYACDDLYLSKN